MIILIRIGSKVSSLAANNDFVFIANGKTLYRHSMKAFKITAKIVLRDLVCQIVLADPQRVLAFSYQTETLFILNEDLQLLLELPFKANYSGENWTD